MSFCNIIQHFRRRILQPRLLSPLSQVQFIQPSPLLSRSYANSTFHSRFPSPQLSFVQAIIIYSAPFFLFNILISLTDNYNKYEIRRVNNAIQKCTLPELNISSDKYYPRSQVLEQLKKIFTPQKNSRPYYFIYGKHGIGKSTLIKMALREVGQGIVYVDIPPDINDFGKNFAKAMNIKISDLTDNVFVSSKNLVPEGSSYGYWVNVKYFEIGDLTEEESINYLVNKKNIKEEEAKKIYELVGGCIIDLEKVADDLFSGQSFEDIKQKIKIEVGKKFRMAKLLPGDQYYKMGRNIINALLDSKEICHSELWKLSDYLEKGKKLLKKNIFEYHPDTHTITLQSKSIEYYIRENADLFIK
ncbi:10232_t:CDS:2 [Diversispora eburnea]|uniref:10232_t:CDS:1 n=1 Tax=Diversispora eburnea TaxID=1213867 RepID=A0A9N8YL97_9GLOM|nr:10232_t:CDS:2 [Diversispora eburnea]